MNTALLKQILATAPDDLTRLLEEGGEDIEKALARSVAEAASNDQKAKFAIGFRIAVDVDNNTFECQLGWSFKQTLSVSHEIEDPRQTGLPFTPETVTIKTGDQEVKLTAEQMKQAAKRITKHLGKK